MVTYEVWLPGGKQPAATVSGKTPAQALGYAHAYALTSAPWRIGMAGVRCTVTGNRVVYTYRKEEK